MGSKIGVIKIAAKRANISFQEYVNRINEGEKFCWKCRAWKSKNRFGVDNSRSDKLAAECFDCRRKTGRPQPISTNKKVQARNAVNCAIRDGKMLPAYKLPCMDCGNKAQDYHHHINYEKSNWLNVQPLCKKCHRKRHS